MPGRRIQRQWLEFHMPRKKEMLILYGIPVIAVTAVGKELEKRDARCLALSSRIAAELGARIVKT